MNEEETGCERGWAESAGKDKMKLKELIDVVEDNQRKAEEASDQEFLRKLCEDPFSSAGIVSKTREHRKKITDATLLKVQKGITSTAEAGHTKYEIKVVEDWEADAVVRMLEQAGFSASHWRTAGGYNIAVNWNV